MKLSYSTLAILALACGAAAAVACSEDSTTARAAAPAAAAPAARAGDDVISSLPAYAKTPGVKLSGNLNSVGSDTMNNLMTLWAEGFARHWPDVKLGVEGKGSATAPPALAEGTAQFGPMSRDMKNEEIDVFEKKHGYKPLRLRTALDALAVFVHKDNPIQSLTLEQVDAIFSKTRARGAEDIKTWGQLGLTGDWADKPIILFGRNSSSGTYGYFKEHALKKGDFKDTVKEQPGSSTVVQGVGTDRFAIGYSGIGYTTSDVRAVPLAAKAGKEAFAANLENVTSEDYPLGRYLNVYINRQPGKPLDPLVREFLQFVFSKDGQGIVEKDGYLPLPAEVAAAERKLLQ